jgi:hypothetical protein
MSAPDGPIKQDSSPELNEGAYLPLGSFENGTEIKVAIAVSGADGSRYIRFTHISGSVTEPQEGSRTVLLYHVEHDGHRAPYVTLPTEPHHSEVFGPDWTIQFLGQRTVLPPSPPPAETPWHPKTPRRFGGQVS